MSPRVLAGVLGVIAIMTAVAFFMTPVSPPGSPLFGCGTVLSPAQSTDVWETAVCVTAHHNVVTWTIPVAFAGLVVLVGAIAIRPRRSADQ